VMTGCMRLQVAPATPNCTSSQSAGRSQGRRQPACSRARTLDGELARRLSTQRSDTSLLLRNPGLTACQVKFQLLQFKALIGPSEPSPLASGVRR
jgi:hypothetical protein